MKKHIIKQEFSSVKVVLKQKKQSILMDDNTETTEQSIDNRSESYDDENNYLSHLLQTKSFETNEKVKTNIENFVTV